MKSSYIIVKVKNKILPIISLERKIIRARHINARINIVTDRINISLDLK